LMTHCSWNIVESCENERWSGEPR